MNSIFQLISYSYNAFNYNHIIHRDKENNVARNIFELFKERKDFVLGNKSSGTNRWKFNYNNLIRNLFNSGSLILFVFGKCNLCDTFRYFNMKGFIEGRIIIFKLILFTKKVLLINYNCNLQVCYQYPLIKLNTKFALLTESRV